MKAYFFKPLNFHFLTIVLPFEYFPTAHPSYIKVSLIPHLNYTYMKNNQIILKHLSSSPFEMCKSC